MEQRPAAAGTRAAERRRSSPEGAAGPQPLMIGTSEEGAAGPGADTSEGAEPGAGVDKRKWAEPVALIGTTRKWAEPVLIGRRPAEGAEPVAEAEPGSKRLNWRRRSSAAARSHTRRVSTPEAAARLRTLMREAKRRLILLT